MKKPKNKPRPKQAKKPASAHIADPRKQVLTRAEVFAEYGLTSKTLQRLEYKRKLLKSTKLLRTRGYFRADIVRVLSESM